MDNEKLKISYRLSILNCQFFKATANVEMFLDLYKRIRQKMRYGFNL